MPKKTTTPRRRQEDIDRAKARPIRWDHDFLDREFIPRKDEQPVPSPGIFDAPYVCVKVNAEWWGHVLGVLEVLRWEDFWLGTSADKYRADQEIQKLMALMESCETMFELRDNPNDPCEVQQSFDGGMTWVTAFRKDNCGDPAVSSLLQFTYNEQAQQFRDQYDGTPESIATDMPPTWTESTPYANDALCYALTRYINTAMDTAYAIGNGQLDDQATLYGIIGGIIGIGLAFVTAGASLGVAALAVGLAAAVGSTTGQIIAAGGTDARWNDTTIRETLICCAYDNLKNGLPNQAAFVNGFECGWVEGSFERLAADWLMDTAQQLDSYLGFLIDMNQLFGLGGQIALPCACEEWCYTIDLSAALPSQVSIVYGSQSATGIESACVPGPSQVSSANYARVVYMAITLAGAANFTEISMTYDAAPTQANFVSTIRNFNLSSIIASQPIGTGTNLTLTWTGDLNMLKVNFTLGLDNGSTVGDGCGGSGRIKTITMRGTGANPFGNDNCA